MMTLKIPTRITKDWIRENCRCVRLDAQPTWLRCAESCEVHCTWDNKDPPLREAIAEATRQVGWRLDWYRDQPKPTKEKRT